jgi:hypothetical protein
MPTTDYSAGIQSGRIGLPTERPSFEKRASPEPDWFQKLADKVFDRLIERVVDKILDEVGLESNVERYYELLLTKESFKTEEELESKLKKAVRAMVSRTEEELTGIISEGRKKKARQVLKPVKRNDETLEGDPSAANSAGK